MFWSFYSQTRKMSTPEIYLEYHCVGRKKPIRGEKINCKQWMLTRLVCGFVASLPVQIFTVIGHNTRNIPEIFQVFPCFTVTTGWARQMTNTYGITIFQRKNCPVEVQINQCLYTYYYNWGGLEMRNYLAGYKLGPFQETSCHSKFRFQFYTELCWKWKEFSNPWQNRD